jgi:uncharacterized membrane protein YfcA
VQRSTRVAGAADPRVGFGVGGGFLIVPALTMLLGLLMRRAIATSLAIITLTGMAALISHLATGAQPDWPLALVLSGAAAAGRSAAARWGAACRLRHWPVRSEWW